MWKMDSTERKAFSCIFFAASDCHCATAATGTKVLILMLILSDSEYNLKRVIKWIKCWYGNGTYGKLLLLCDLIWQHAIFPVQDRMLISECECDNWHVAVLWLWHVKQIISWSFHIKSNCHITLIQLSMKYLKYVMLWYIVLCYEAAISKYLQAAYVCQISILRLYNDH